MFRLIPCIRKGSQYQFPLRLALLSEKPQCNDCSALKVDTLSHQWRVGVCGKDYQMIRGGLGWQQQEDRTHRAQPRWGLHEWGVVTLSCIHLRSYSLFFQLFVRFYSSNYGDSLFIRLGIFPINLTSDWENLLLIWLGRFTIHPTGKICYASDREDASQSIDCIACCALHCMLPRVLLTRWLEPACDGLIACDDKQYLKNSVLLVFPCPPPNRFRRAPSFPIRRPLRRMSSDTIALATRLLKLSNMFQDCQAQGNARRKFCVVWVLSSAGAHRVVGQIHQSDHRGGHWLLPHYSLTGRHYHH